MFDQLIHYFNTYGLGNFDEPGHSVFEKDFERAAFQEDTEVQEFVIQTEEEAEETVRISYSGSLVQDNSMAVKDTITSTYFQTLFPNVKIRKN